MKKLTVEEAEGLNPIKATRISWVVKALANLKIGEAIIIENADWKSKMSPYKAIRTAEKLLNMTFEYGRMPDKSGWLVKRIK